MTHVILGAGAVGSALAAELTLAGMRVLLVARGAQLDHLRAHGLTYRRPQGTRQVALPVTGLAGLRLAPDDVLWLAVKTQDAEAATADLAQVPGAERIAARRFARLYAAVVRTPAIFTETGRVKVLAEPWFAAVSLGRFPFGTDALSARLVADLTLAGALAEEHADIARWKAQKLTYNVRNVVELFAGDGTEAAEALTAEATEILRATGHDPAEDAERRLTLTGWRIYRDAEDPGGQSTWQSFTRGTSHEVDYLNGEVVLQARLHGLTAPWNAAAQDLARELAAKGGMPGQIPIRRLIALARPNAAGQ